MLQTDIDWKKQQIAVGRREQQPAAVVAEPRLTIFMSDPGICYEYSGRENIGEGWHPAVLEIKEKAERGMQECGLSPVVFNSVQLNRYNGPRHTLGMHADDEPDLERGAPIVSVSFGCTREFRIQRRDKPGDPATSMELADGSFLAMGGDMQRHYLHGVPAGGQTGLRLNLTFRMCVPRAARTVAGVVQLQPGLGGRSSHAEVKASPEVERFIEENELDQRAASVLLLSSPEEQQFVMDLGGLTNVRNPSSVVLSRLRDAKTKGGGKGGNPKA